MAISFDDLSKRLGMGLSRRQALKLTFGTVGGGMLASVALPEQALAANDCAVFCGKTSFTSGPAHASCLKACKACGGDTSRICQGSTGSVCCAPGGSCCFGNQGQASCCAPGTLCIGNNQCVPAGRFCVPTCGGDTCSGPTSCNQACTGGTGGCGCVSTTEGTPACVQQVCTFVRCTSSAECGGGAVCFTQGCCGT